MQYIWYFIQQVYKQWFLIFGAIIGLISGIITIFPLPEKSGITNFILFLICFFISVIGTLIIYKIKIIPDDEIWMLEEPRDKPTIAFPYQKAYLRAASILARSHYGKSAVSYDVCRKWYEKNPFALTVLADSYNKFVGYFDILPLETNFGKDLVNGIVSEKDIKQVDILPPDKMQNSEYIYIAGISVKDQSSQIGRKHGAILIYATMIYLETFYDFTKPKKIYAIAATDCGMNILKKLSFQIETDETNRKDKMDLYSRTINKDQIDNFRKQFDFCDNKFDYTAYKKAISANLKMETLV